MPQRQLNIRSDEAASLAASLSKRLGKTATEVVVEALRGYEIHNARRDELGLTAEGRRRYDALLQLARQTSAQIRPGADFDDNWMYDENGLPK